MIGVDVSESYMFPFAVKISVGDIGGPSAGMMFALGIIDKLTPMNLTGGKFIAGTGEISANGAVGPDRRYPAEDGRGAGRGRDRLPDPGRQLPGYRRCRSGRDAPGQGQHAEGAVDALEALKAGKPVSRPADGRGGAGPGREEHWAMIGGDSAGSRELCSPPPVTVRRSTGTACARVRLRP